MKPFRLKVVRVLLLFLLSFVITTTFQKWVGDMTIYSPGQEKNRMERHTKILNNEVSEGKRVPGKISIARTKTRIFTVYLADRLSSLMGKSIYRTYRMIDTVCLNLIFISLFMYLRKWFNYTYSLIGILYLGCILVLTYLFHDFHPWDRISLLSWILLLFLIQDNRPVWFALVLAISVTIKYDVLLLPGLYWMFNVMKENWKRTSMVTLVLFGVSFGVFYILKTVFPASETITDPNATFSNILFHLKTTHRYMLASNIRSYPPFLVFLLPVILSLYRLRSRERFIFANAMFGFVMLTILYLMTNFHEVRAEMPVLILLLPAALMSLRDILEPESDSSVKMGII